MSAGWAYIVQQGLNALQVSAFYALLAAAYVLVHGAAGRINLAFGAIAMWGAYLTIGGVAVVSATSRIPLPAVGFAIFWAAVGTAALGFVIARGIIMPLIRAVSLPLLIATIGLSIALEETMRLVNRSRERLLRPILADPLVTFGPPEFIIRITIIQAIVVLTAVSLAIVTGIMLRRNRFGRAWRAAAQDIGMLELLGVNPATVAIAATVIASTLAAAAGIMIAIYYGSVTFSMGAILGLKALYVAVIGGLNSLGGAVVGALLLGGFETVWSATVSSDYRDVASFLALTVLLIFRPQGLFTPAGRVDHIR